MIIPFGFGKGCIGRVFLKYSTNQLQSLFDEPINDNRCGYNVIAYNIQKMILKCILDYRLQPIITQK